MKQTPASTGNIQQATQLKSPTLEQLNQLFNTMSTTPNQLTMQADSIIHLEHLTHRITIALRSHPVSTTTTPERTNTHSAQIN